MRDLLKKTGYQLVEAHDGEAALDRVASEHFDLVLMDIQLPGIDGYEVARRIQAGFDQCGRADYRCDLIRADGG